MQLLAKYFSNLSQNQKKQFLLLEGLYREWNAKINVISRKSIDDLYTIHVLHSLAIAKVISFQKNTSVLDVGTGGGFPGIPLAILFPEVNFVLVDSIKKKIKVVDEIVSGLKINNVITRVDRAEDIYQDFDFIVSRAVTNMPAFQNIIKNKFNKKENNILNNGILYLKGGDLQQELKAVRHAIYPISDFFEEDFFKTKKVIYIASKDI